MDPLAWSDELKTGHLMVEDQQPETHVAAAGESAPQFGDVRTQTLLLAWIEIPGTESSVMEHCAPESVGLQF